MRKEQIENHKRLLDKYATDDDILEFIELTQRIYRQLDGMTLDFGDYLYNILSYRNNEMYGVKQLENKF